MSFNQRVRLFLLAAMAVPVLYVGLPAMAKPRDRDVSPMTALTGHWKAELSPSQSVLLDFRDDTVQLTVEAGGAAVSKMGGKVSLPKDQPDRHMTWTNMQSGGRDLPDNKCLYQVMGDTLLLIGGGPNDRPTQFYSGPGGEPRTMIFTRVELPAK